MTKTKKKGIIDSMKENTKTDRDRFTRSVTEGKDYENLYDIGSAIRRIDSTNLIIGVIGVLAGLLMFSMSIILPFVLGKGFHLGFWAALGMMIFLSGLFYYIGSYRILHPLSKAVAVEKDHVIRGILKERIVVYDDGNNEEEGKDTD